MTPAYSLSISLPLPFRTRYPFQRTHKCARTLRLSPSTSFLPPMTGLPGVFPITIAARLPRSPHHPSSFFQPFHHIPALPFPIQNT
jgi:hypothetical protein